MARRARAGRGTGDTAPVGPDLKAQGGTWSLVSDQELDMIADAALHILTEIGMSQAPQIMVDTITAAGGRAEGGRLYFPRDLLIRAIQDGAKSVLLAGQDPKHDMQVGGTAVYTGTGGAAPRVMHPETGDYRDSSVRDLYYAARLADRLEHVHFFSRSLVACDISDPLEFDMATAAVSLLGTAKHVIVAASDPTHVAQIAALCHEVAGGEEAFRARPFLSLNVNHVVPPLRFHAEAVEVMAEAVRHGIPVHCNVFGQLGASSPVTMAGSVAQTIAETLAGVAFIHALDPNAPRIAGPRPMITDLKTGGMAGGAGEQAVATGLAVKVLRRWDMPCSVIAGATDSKLPDFQAGYEKSLSIESALRAGANLVTQAAGMQAGLMGVSFAAMVADSDMIGAILRANVAPKVTEETLALASIAEVVAGEGHFLGRPETYARMRSDFLYPQVADRRSIDEWASTDRADMGQRAANRAKELLNSHWPTHGPAEMRQVWQDRYALLPMFSGETV